MASEPASSTAPMTSATAHQLASFNHRTEAQAGTRLFGAFHLFTVADLDTLPEPEWLVDGLLPDGGLGMVYGEPGAYKTFLALDWALCVTAGLAWHEREVCRGDVVYVYAEGAKGLPKRIRAWLKARGGDVGRFRALPRSLDIRDEADIQRLVEAIAAASLSPALVVIDTLARNFGDGDENTQKDMGAFVAGCDAIRLAFPDTAVLVVHHDGKKAKSRERGSTALRGAVDTVMHVKLSGAVTLTCEKQKDAEPFGPIHMTPKPVSLEGANSSIVLQRSAADCVRPNVGATQRAATNDMKALEALRALGPAGATFSEWKATAGLRDSTFKDVRARLVTENKVRQENGRYFAVQ